MDQYSHYLMWMKSKHHHILNSPHFDQEHAFAEDAHGPLGGFVWPPKCYSCTFCKREFRSSQALGGHMNVHRRDRARLKQSLCPQTEDTTHKELFPSQVISSSSKYSSPSSFVASPPRENSFSKQTNVSLISAPIIRSQAPKNDLSYSKTVACKSNMRKEESTFEGHVDGYVETNLSVGLNFGVSRTRPVNDIGGDFKRRKTDDVFALPFSFKGCSNDKDHIDLELRLGDSPTVK